MEAPRFTDVLLSAALGAPKRLEVMAGAVDVLDAAGAEVEVEDSAGLPRLNSPPEGAGAGVEDVAEDDDCPPRLLKRLGAEVAGVAVDEEAAGWDEGAEGKENVGLVALDEDVETGVEKMDGAAVPLDAAADD